MGADSDRSWRGNDTLALGLRFGLAVLPALTAFIAVIATMRLTPTADTTVGALGWIVLAAAVGFSVAHVMGRITVRALPLAALLRLSLAFPDQAPSRLKLAIRASSPKRLKAEVESARHHGLSSDATEAAGQVLLLTAALGEHDRRTRGHSERVRLFARLLGEEMGLKGEDLERLQWGALLHDIGKLTIPTEILNKPGKLDDAEWVIMSSHAEAGTDLVAPLHAYLGRFVTAADGHHEKWDGTGYPRGLRGTDIPLPARIVAVADAYEVMTATRAYKKPMSAEAARAELTACAGTHFDPDVVRAWLNVSVGDVNKAAGPAAAIAGLPLLGELVALGGRTATQLAGLPTAVAGAAPAAATAGAMTVAAVAAPSIAVPDAELAFAVQTSSETTPGTLDVEASATTMVAPSSTSETVAGIASEGSPHTPPPPADGEGDETSTTTSQAPTTSSAPTASPAPSITAPSPTTTGATAAPSTTTSTGSPTTSTSLPSTSTTTAAPSTTTSTVVARRQPGSSGSSLQFQGPLEANADLTSAGPFDGGTHLFTDAAQVTTRDIDIDGTLIPAGSTVCVHLFTTTASGEAPFWRLDYDRDVLAVADRSGSLTATDDLQASGVIYGDSSVRGAEQKDDVNVVAANRRVQLRLDGADMDSVRIFVDCSD